MPLSLLSRLKRVGLRVSPLFYCGFAFLCSAPTSAETLRLDSYQARAAEEATAPVTMVVIRIEGEVRRAFADFTRKYISRQVVIRVDGKEVARPMIMTAIEGSQFPLNIDESKPEFSETVKRLLQGSATLEIASD